VEWIVDRDYKKKKKKSLSWNWMETEIVETQE
jgi:hypothetical protein